MSQVAVLPHQTSNGSSAAAAVNSSVASGSQPDIGQLSLHNHHFHHPHHHHNSARRKSSFSSSSSSSTHSNSYRTMPLSRTRSLLANINGVANGANGTSNGVGNGGSSTANTPGSEANGYALPSINGSSDHLPPLKSGGPAAVNGSSVVASNNNKFFNGGVVSNGVTNGSLTNGYLHGHDMDVISTTGSSSLQSTTTSLTNGHLSHINGMQTLPHVRSSAATGSSSEGRQQIIGFGSEDIPDKDLFDNDKSQSTTAQQATQQSANNSQSTAASVSVSVANQQNSVQHSPTNSSALSNNAVNAANNSGSLKPKTMVATPEQVLFQNSKMQPCIP